MLPQAFEIQYQPHMQNKQSSWHINTIHGQYWGFDNVRCHFLYLYKHLIFSSLFALGTVLGVRCLLGLD